MKREQGNIRQIGEGVHGREETLIGRIVRIDGEGQVFVDFPGNNAGPLVARTTSSARSAMVRAANPAGREVLLIFAHNDPHLPIIVDTMFSLIEEISEYASADHGSHEPEVAVDGKRIVLEAENEIVLTCGAASITLTKAGKILIKGEYVLSHAAGVNRIRGGAVRIN